MSTTKNTSRHMTRYGVTALVMAAALAGVAFAIDWVELGPAPLTDGGLYHTGRVSALVCSPTDPNRFFAGGADGGVWRTTDLGQTWTPLTNGLPTQAIGALALDPTNENIVYAGSGEANFANHSRYGLGLYKSIDGGDTWQILAADTFAGRCFSKICIHPQNPQRMYAAITPAGGFPAMAAAKGHPLATGPVGVFRSDDAGVTWTQLLNGLPNLAGTDLAMDPTTPSTLYACIGHIFGSTSNGIYKTTDGGDTWAKLGGGLPGGTLGRISMAVAPSSPQWLYALVANPSDSSGGNASTRGAYRSANYGSTWTALPNLGSIQATYGWYLCVVGVNPQIPSQVYMGGVTFHQSGNGGSNWSDATPPHVDMHAIAFNANGELLVGDDGGVHYSPDGGSEWFQLNGGLGVVQCYAGLSTHPTNDDVMFAGLQDNGSVQRQSDGSWINRLGGDGGWTQVDQSNPNYVFVEYQGSGTLYRSTNGGTTFNASGSGISGSDRNCFMPPYLINPSDSARMLYATQRIYRSTNHGASWTPISGDITGGGSAAVRTLAFAPSNPSFVYAATNDGLIKKSIDGGVTWTLLLSNVPGWPRVTRELWVHPTDPQTVYLAVAYFNQTQLQRTRDGGQTWEALDANFPDIPVNVVAVDVRGNLPVIYAGSDAGVYRSVNGGGSWHRYGNGLPDACVIDLQLQPGRGRLLASTQGRGIWTIPVALPGDMNGNGATNNFDITPFVLALTDPVAYAQQFPGLDPILVGDMNGDGRLDNFDISGFVELLVAP